MTEKQENIVRVALELFAHHGYAHTTTSKIASAAEVSEGLIFRHFGSKEGLLDAIVQIGLQETEQYATQIMEENDPQQQIFQTIRFPLYLIRKQGAFWKLQLTLKYQSPEVAQKYHESNVLTRLHQTLEQAFQALHYPNPKAETKFLMVMVGSLFSVLEQEDESAREAFVNFIQSKYKA